MALHCNVFLLDVAQHVCPWRADCGCNSRRPCERYEALRQLRRTLFIFFFASLSSRRYAVARCAQSADNHTHAISAVDWRRNYYFRSMVNVIGHQPEALTHTHTHTFVGWALRCKIEFFFFKNSLFSLQISFSRNFDGKGVSTVSSALVGSSTYYMLQSHISVEPHANNDSSALQMYPLQWN